MISPTRFRAAVCMAACAISINAQIPTGSIGGIATDGSGARIPSVQVNATSESQGVMREGQSNVDGSFTLPNLTPGAYTVVFKPSGFGEVRYPHVQIEGGKTTTLDTILHAAAKSTVDIGTADGQVDLTQSMLQGQITSNTFASIPLNGRSFLELAFLIPGNRPAANFDPTETDTVEVSSAGSFGRVGNIIIDGGDNNDEVVGGTLANLPQDSVGEFQIAWAASQQRLVAPETASSTSSRVPARTNSTALRFFSNAIAIFTSKLLADSSALAVRAPSDSPHAWSFKS